MAGFGVTAEVGTKMNRLSERQIGGSEKPLLIEKDRSQ
jgi:hypothetical protein